MTMCRYLSRGLLILLACISLPTLAAIDVFDFDSPEQEAQFQELSHTLRCPKCQNNSIADSNAELAKDLRQKTYGMVKQGKSEQEIVDYMVARYGNFVTYNPPITASTAILWLAPLSVVFIGFLFIVLRSRKRVRVDESQQWDAQKQQRLDELLQSQPQPKNDHKGDGS